MAQNPNQPFDYEKSWKNVQESNKKGLPETARKEVEEIYKRAKSEKNTQQWVKAIIHRIRYFSIKEEEALPKTIALLNQEIEEAPFPVKPLLYSLRAELYWQHYTTNRWKYSDRSTVVNFKQDDIETWSLDKIIQETTNSYELSLASSEKLKEYKIDQLKEILQEGNKLGRSYRPTLYDFLAHRALDFYSGEEPSITKPSYAFTLNDDKYFSNANTFAKIEIKTADTLSLKLHALQLFQKLLSFHLNDKDPSALVDVDLKRLEFVKNNSTHPNKGALYLKALNNLETNSIKYPISTYVTYLIAKAHQEKGALYQPLQSEDHKWELKKAYEIADTGQSRFPESYGAILCNNLKIEITQKSLSAQIEQVTLPGQPFLARIEYKNFQNLFWRIIPIGRAELDIQRTKLNLNNRRDREQMLMEYFIQKKPLTQGKVVLPMDGDFQQHSTEIKLEEIPIGLYVILFSNKGNFSTTDNAIAYAYSQQSNISYIQRNLKNGSTEFYTLHRASGEPLNGVKAQLYHHKYVNDKFQKVIGEIFQADKDGYLSIPFQSERNLNNFSVKFINSIDTLSTESLQSDYYYGGFYQSRQSEPTLHTQTLFFLDRAIYRPGQTIYFKGLVIETNRKKSEILPKKKVSVILHDVNYQQVSKQEFVTNEFGTFQGTFTAPNTGMMGQMSLSTPEGNGNVYFSVEEYKRPKFEVKFDPIKENFRLGETIQVKGYAKAYAGSNIDGAKVSYRVVRNTIYPPWWGYWKGYFPSSPSAEIINGITETDAHGNFSFSFKAIPDESIDKASDPIFTYTVYADVTDINGETRSNTTEIKVGYKALTINVNINDIDKSNIDNKKQYEITTNNLVGEFIPAKGTLAIFKLNAPDRPLKSKLWETVDKWVISKEEFIKYFPDYEYRNENNPTTWPKEKEVYQLSFNTADHKTFQINNLDNWESGQYLLEIHSTDQYNQEVKELKYFKVFSSKENKPAIPIINLFQEIETKVEPGNKAKIFVGTSANKIQVLYEIEQAHEIISKEWLTFKNEQRLLEIPIKEEYRGNIAVHYTFIYNNRLYNHTSTINVPYSNKELDISFETFRDKLSPGEKEQWRLKIKGNKADKIAAEMVATLYDASLDIFRTNTWDANFFHNFSPLLHWNTNNSFQPTNFLLFLKNWNNTGGLNFSLPKYDELNWFGYSLGNYMLYEVAKMEKKSMITASPALKEDLVEISMSADMEVIEPSSAPSMGKEAPPSPKKEIDLSQIKARKNFNETAFFYPNLYTNEAGEIIISFTIPEALTRWKMLGFAHTKDLKSGLITNELVTQKELMVVPNQPRFFRENDKMVFSVKVTSFSEKELSGQAQLDFFDALTMKPVNEQMKNAKIKKDFSVKAGQSTNLEWTIEIPEGLQAVTYKVVAKAGNFSDGEEMTIPVVTNRMLVTETLPLPIKGNQTKEFKFRKLLNNNSTTLKNHKYTLEFTSNPAWYAVQALPYLMEYPYECIEQIFNRFYANSIATHIATSNPKIKNVFDQWKNIQPDALLSNLEKNQELKTALLEETPWVLQAKDESQRKRSIALLFDLNRMSEEMEKSLDKIIKAQSPNGGFSWFPGFPTDPYITQYIVAAIGHLEVMGVKSVKEDAKLKEMLQRSLTYMDEKIKEDYSALKARAKRGEIKLEDNHLSFSHIQYLYARSYFKETAINKNSKEAFDYFLNQAKEYWLKNNIYLEGMICLALHRYGETVDTKNIIKSLNERALHHEEFGMYWKTNNGFYWYQADIETQALMIELYDEVAQDQTAVEELKVWLLKQKQTQDWKTTKATAEACYALLRRGSDALANSNLVEITIGKEKIDPLKRPDTKVEAGTGYFKTSWNTSEIKPEMGNIVVSKKDNGVAWGAVYWQYFEQLDKITPAETPLKINKKLFLEKPSDRGPVITPIDVNTELKVGDLVKVRVEIRVDRNMEYVQLKDMRAAGLEPVNTLSTAKHQDGLWYYESTRDLATNFFMGYLPKGTYVFEYPLRVSAKGNFSNGITTIQCMYAPEFSSHSEGIRVVVK